MRRAKLVVLFLMVALAMPLMAQKNKPKVAVLKFDFSPIKHWWWGNYDIGEGIQALVEDELLDRLVFRIYSRKYLNDLLKEQDFQQTRRADPTTAVQIGKLAGVKYIIVGTVFKFEQKKKGGGLGFVTKKLGFGGGAVKLAEAKVGITAQLIDVQTGEILFSAKAEDKSTGVFVAGITSAGGGFLGGDSSISKAAEKAVKKLVDNIVKKSRALGLI